METSVTADQTGTRYRPGEIPVMLLRLVDLQRGHLFNWTPVAFGAGIGIYFGLRFEPDLQIALGIVAALICISILVRLAGYRLPVLLMAATISVAGFASASWRAHLVDAPVLGFRYYGPIEGRIVKIDRSQSNKPRLTLDQVVLDNVEPHRRPSRVRVSLHGEQPYLTPRPGMVVMMTGHLSPPSGPVEPGGFDFQRKSWFEGLGAVGYTRTPALLLSVPEQSGLAIRVQQLRHAISNALKSRMSAQEGPFAAAVITGDRGDVDPVALEALRASNLAHLLAISGLHMGLLTGAVLMLARAGLALVPRVSLYLHPKRAAAICALIIAASYLVISGASVATQRAFIMVCVMLVALCLDRRALTLRAVAIAALLVLVWTPESLTGPGFQMSFAATTALVACFGVLRNFDAMARLPRWSRGFVSLVLSSLIAGLATAPFGAAHFNQIAHYGLFANLLSVPVMGMVVMPGALLAALLAPIGFASAGLWVMELGIRWILFIAHTVAGLDGATSKVVAPQWWVLPLFAAGGLVFCLWQGRGRLAGVLVIAATILGWSQSQRPEVLISETGRLIGVMTGDGRALNKPKGDGFSARVWLENDGDRATQEQAAARSDSPGDLVDLTIDGRHLVFDARKDPPREDIEAYCRQADIVIAARYKEDPPCDLHTEASLRVSGALALSRDLEITSTRDARGDRLWTGRPKRSNPQ